MPDPDSARTPWDADAPSGPSSPDDREPGGPDARARLEADIERTGYYPALVAEAVDAALAGEPVRSWLVHQETTFDTTSETAEVRRHVTVLVLTPSRLIVGHTDEHGADETSPVPYASTSTEAASLDRVASVVLTRVVADPARYVPGATPREVTLTVGWGSVSRIDLEPAGCSDPQCDADHGYVGSATAEDLTLRVSEAAEGGEVVRGTLRFAADLSAATAGGTAGGRARVALHR